MLSVKKSDTMSVNSDNETRGPLCEVFRVQCVMVIRRDWVRTVLRLAFDIHFFSRFVFLDNKFT